MATIKNYIDSYLEIIDSSKYHINFKYKNDKYQIGFLDNEITYLVQDKNGDNSHHINVNWSKDGQYLNSETNNLIKQDFNYTDAGFIDLIS